MKVNPALSAIHLVILYLLLQLCIKQNCFGQEPVIGHIGDVKFSILDPEQFKSINGEGWKLMDGASIVGSDLHRRTNGEISTVPDARALFIRGMNYGREDAYTDHDGVRARQGSGRQGGDVQADAVVNHKHKYYKPNSETPENKAAYSPHSDGPPVDPSPNQSTDGIATGIPGSEYVSVSEFETRPNNISLYIYMKVDE